MVDWLKGRRRILRELREMRASRDGAVLGLLRAVEDAEIWRGIAAHNCKDVTGHARLAHQLHVAQVALADLRGEDPHTASLRPPGGSS